MGSNEKGKIYRKPWFLILVIVFIIAIAFEGPAKPLVSNSFAWLLILFMFFASLAVGVYVGFRGGKLVKARQGGEN
jgi:uncharacterized membrane protein YhaH (DUF805 family)